MCVVTILMYRKLSRISLSARVVKAQKNSLTELVHQQPAFLMQYNYSSGVGSQFADFFCKISFTIFMQRSRS